MIKGIKKKSRKTTPFTIVTNNVKYLGVTLTKPVKDLYDKTSSLRRKKLEKIVGDKKYLPCSSIGKMSIVKMASLPKAIYKFNAIPAKVITQFFIDLERTLLNFI